MTRIEKKIGGIGNRGAGIKGQNIKVKGGDI